MRGIGAEAVISMMLGLGLSLAASAEQTTNVAGHYVMKGKGFGPIDTAYEGTSTLQGDGPAYEVSCFNNFTRHTYVGRGLANGETLAVTIGDYLRGDHGGLFAGEYLIVYRRKPDGVFEGIWIDSSGVTGSERLTRLD